MKSKARKKGARREEKARGAKKRREARRKGARREEKARGAKKRREVRRLDYLPKVLLPFASNRSAQTFLRVV